MVFEILVWSDYKLFYFEILLLILCKHKLNFMSFYVFYWQGDEEEAILLTKHKPEIENYSNNFGRDNSIYLKKWRRKIYLFEEIEIKKNWYK